MKLFIRALIILTTGAIGLPVLLVLLVLGFIFISDFSCKDEVAATSRTSNGMQLFVAQVSDGPYLSYSHSFFAKQPGAGWRWYVLDHEESCWRNVKIDVDEKTQKATIYQDNRWIGEFNLRNQYLNKPSWSSSGDVVAPDSWSIDQVFERHKKNSHGG